MVGLWFIAAPFALGGTFQATASDVIVGLLIVASSLWMAVRAEAPEWCNWALMLFGVWAIVASFALGYRPTTNAMTNDVAAGIVVLAVAIVRAAASILSPACKCINRVRELAHMQIWRTSFLKCPFPQLLKNIPFMLRARKAGHTEVTGDLFIPTLVEIGFRPNLHFVGPQVRFAPR